MPRFVITLDQFYNSWKEGHESFFPRHTNQPLTEEECVRNTGRPSMLTQNIVLAYNELFTFAPIRI